MSIKPSELILNPDGSVYHLKLKPGQVANTIITVGDQDRVAQITKHFDSIELTTQKREFKTQTGTFKGKRLTVISTGIGPDNIDIVFNELDALVNIDFETRTPKDQITSLDFIRIGTSGSLQADIPVDSFVLSTHGLELHGMLQFYKHDFGNNDVINSFIDFTNWNKDNARPLLIENSKKLEHKLESEKTFKGITATAGGFYGPQGRVLRIPLQNPELNRKMDTFNFNGIRITNFEMETSTIYGMCKLLGHHALSLNAIIANRANGTFSENPKQTIENLIEYTLEKIFQ